MKQIVFSFLLFGLLLSACDKGPDLVLIDYQNDSWDGMAAPTFKSDAAASDLVGASLGPVSGVSQVNSVSFMYGGGSGTFNVTIKINEEGGTVNPNLELYSGTHTVTASDNTLQVIDLKNENILINSGKFRVTVGLQNAGLPSIATDGATQIDKSNWYKPNNSGTWKTAASLGITDNFIIRADVFRVEE